MRWGYWPGPSAFGRRCAGRWRLSAQRWRRWWPEDGSQAERNRLETAHQAAVRASIAVVLQALEQELDAQLRACGV